MKLITSILLLSTSLSALALPQPNLVDTSSVGQLALNGVAGAISKIGDGGVHAMTRWDWNDCGKLIKWRSIRYWKDWTILRD